MKLNLLYILLTSLFILENNAQDPIFCVAVQAFKNGCHRTVQHKGIEHNGQMGLEDYEPGASNNWKPIKFSFK
jgi:hypothetical protein